MLKKIAYELIYSGKSNFVLRNLSYAFKNIVPEKFKLHPSGLVKVNIKGADPIFLKTNQTSYVTRELFWKGSENYEYTPIFKKLITKVDTFLDVGSSIGYYSILGAHLNESLEAIAFEPAPGSLRYLSQNIKLNNLGDRVKAENIALSDTEGTLIFAEIRNAKYPDTPNLSGEHNLGTKPLLLSKEIEVQSTTLDSYFISNAIANVDLMKLDTEGVEDAIIRSGQKTIERFKPIIICETLFDRIEDSLDNLMRAQGYLFFNHVGSKLVQVDTIMRKEDNGIRNCFFVHPSKLALIKEFVKDS